MELIDVILNMPAGSRLTKGAALELSRLSDDVDYPVIHELRRIVKARTLIDRNDVVKALKASRVVRSAMRARR